MSTPEAPPAVSPEMFRTLAEAANICVFVHTEDRFLYANPAAERLVGYSIDEILDSHPDRFVHPDHRAMVEDRRRRRLAGEPTPGRYEFKVVRKDGAVRWVLFTGNVITWGGARAGMATCVDVTEGKQVEETLRERLRLDRLVADVARHFVHLPVGELEAGLQESMRRMGEGLGVDRSQLFLVEGGRARSVAAWCLAEVAPAPFADSAFDLADYPWSTRRLDSRETLVIRHTDELPPEAAPEAALYAAHGVRSVVGVPIHTGERLQGFLVFDSVRREREWDEPVLTVLSLVSELLSSVLERQRTETELRRSQETLELAQIAGRSIVWDWEVASDRMHLSPFAMELFGASAEEVPTTGEAFVRFVPPEDREAIAEGLRRALRGEAPYVLEHRILTPHGETRWLAVRGQVFPGDSGPRVVGVSSDITEHKAAEEALLREQERADITLASIGDGVLRVDAGGRIDYLNRVAESLTGWTSDEARGRPLADVYQVVEEGTELPRHDPVAAAMEAREVVVRTGHHVLRSRDGREFAIRDSAAPVIGRGGQLLGVVVAFQDVTQVRGLEREMSYLARHDPLTGLINRRELERRLQAALTGARQGIGRHVLCYLDLDEFKLVNDTCGHVAGDHLLRQVTALLSSQLREGDLLARLGGDEFGVLLYDCTLGGGRSVAEKLCTTVRQFRFRWEDRLFDVGASLGVVPIDESSGSLHQVLSAADAACYVAKEQGRNRVHLYQPDDRAMAKRYGEMQWVQRIHRAFEEGGFRLFRQPIRPLVERPGTPPMAEVLLRMRNPRGGYFPTASFIAAAERYHLMERIDRWVVDGALTAGAELGWPEVLTINLSGQSLGDPAFLAFALERLTHPDIDPDKVCFEVTETAAITNLGRAGNFLSAVKEIGCRVVLDDFGTGLSSFSYLKTLPVDFLKIDGEFVRHLVDDPVQRALVEAIHQIGRVMGLETIAEAVETAETLELLEEMGIDWGQGYHLGRPVPMSGAEGGAMLPGRASG